MTTHTDLSRDMGRVEAGLEALEKAMTQGFQDIKDELKIIKSDVEDLKKTENQRKGAFQLGHWVVGAVSAIAALLVEHFWK